jgi:hypothetical protein
MHSTDRKYDGPHSRHDQSLVPLAAVTYSARVRVFLPQRLRVFLPQRLLPRTVCVCIASSGGGSAISTKGLRHAPAMAPRS